MTVAEKRRRMAPSAVNRRRDSSYGGARSRGQTLIRLAENAHQHRAHQEAPRLTELAYARFFADCRE